MLRFLETKPSAAEPVPVFAFLVFLSGLILPSGITSTSFVLLYALCLAVIGLKLSSRVHHKLPLFDRLFPVPWRDK